MTPAVMQLDRAENISSQEKVEKIQQATQDVIYNKDLPRDTISCTAIHEEMSFFPWEQAYVLSDTGGCINVTPIHQPTRVRVRAVKTAL